jgi:ribosomal protein S21
VPNGAFFNPPPGSFTLGKDFMASQANLVVEVFAGDIEGALRNLKKKYDRTGLARELRRRAAGYERPGVRKRRKSAVARARVRKNEKKKKLSDWKPPVIGGREAYTVVQRDSWTPNTKPSTTERSNTWQSKKRF